VGAKKTDVLKLQQSNMQARSHCREQQIANARMQFSTTKDLSLGIILPFF
jgi:hypothetical protein